MASWQYSQVSKDITNKLLVFPEPPNTQILVQGSISGATQIKTCIVRSGKVLKYLKYYVWHCINAKSIEKMS